MYTKVIVATKQKKTFVGKGTIDHHEQFLLCLKCFHGVLKKRPNNAKIRQYATLVSQWQNLDNWYFIVPFDFK